MNEQDKQLLLRDLCARLPYGLKVRYKDPEYSNLETTIQVRSIHTHEDFASISGYIGEKPSLGTFNVEDIKPYLFPLSSMTEEQKEEYHKVLYDSVFEGLIIAVDWLNERHYDYRGLLERGLGIDATNLNIY